MMKDTVLLHGRLLVKALWVIHELLVTTNQGHLMLMLFCILIRQSLFNCISSSLCLMCTCISGWLFIDFIIFLQYFSVKLRYGLLRRVILSAVVFYHQKAFFNTFFSSLCENIHMWVILIITVPFLLLREWKLSMLIMITILNFQKFLGSIIKTFCLYRALSIILCFINYLRI